MNFLFPTLAAVLQASSMALDKVTLSIKKVTYKTYNGISFPLIFVFTLIIFLIIKPPFSVNFFTAKLTLLISISIAIMAITNIIFYRSLKSEYLNEMQILSLLSGFPLIIIAGFIFADERNPLFIFLALIATGAVVWSHWERNHFYVAKKTWPFLIWTISVAPFSGIISKILLETWNPISLQLIRDGAIAIIFIPLFFKNIKNVPSKAVPLLLLTNILTTIAWILFFFSYQIFGIVYTILIFSLKPILVYFASVFFLKEKFEWKKFTAFIIIIIAIIASKVIG